FHDRRLSWVVHCVHVIIIIGSSKDNSTPQFSYQECLYKTRNENTLRHRPTFTLTVVWSDDQTQPSVLETGDFLSPDSKRQAEHKVQTKAGQPEPTTRIKMIPSSSYTARKINRTAELSRICVQKHRVGSSLRWYEQSVRADSCKPSLPITLWACPKKQAVTATERWIWSCATKLRRLQCPNDLYVVRRKNFRLTNNKRTRTKSTCLRELQQLPQVDLRHNGSLEYRKYINCLYVQSSRLMVPLIKNPFRG
ncbi:hypothetical protein CLF_111267, partial [Clonorchis sinensis]